MKSSTIPSLRVEPEFRSEIESLLGDGETLSQFVETALRSTVQRRRVQTEFLQRGIAAIEETKAKGNGIPAEAVIARLEAKLAAARRNKSEQNP